MTDGLWYFESLDDMLNAMKQAENKANEMATEDQKQIGYGDYFIRIWEADRMFGGDDLKIYGRIMTREEFIKTEKDCGALDDELAGTMQTHDSSYARGYRWGWCYSIVEPTGELGSTHVSVMRKIGKEEFEEAERKGWK